MRAGSASAAPHGRALACWHKHDQDDAKLGIALCPDCYAYDQAVIWNALAPVLWRRTTIYLRRALARLAGRTVAGLARQVRIIRLDGVTEDGVVVPPPPWATVELLTQAIREATSAVSLPSPAGLKLGPVGWGDQLDIRPITTGTLGEGSAGHVAGYLAKYATKATEGLAGVALDRPIRSARDLARRALPEHVRRLVEAAWRLGGRPELAGLRLRAWAHQLGYGGHCTTKSRRYSTTFTALRRARHEHARRRAFGGTPLDAWGRPEHEKAAVQVTGWTYAGRGYSTLADAWLARCMLDSAREQRRIAREELRAVA